MQLDFPTIRSFFRRYGGYVIIFFHTIGLFLLGGHWRQDFVFLTSYNLLLLMAVYLVSSETPKNKFTYILPVVLGFAIEVVGTNTGWPFGEYTYGSALGLSIANTPLMIGVLWWLLIRSMYDVLSVKISSVWTKSLLVGVAMTAMDVLIEPVAIELNFWSWEGVSVPMSNYIAWFVLSTLFTRITASGHAKNPMSLWVLMVLNVFFTILCLRY